VARLARVVASGYPHHATQRGNRRQPIRCIHWPPARYIENNPVRAGLCAHSEDWPWSSARAHLNGEDDALVRVSPMLALVSNWREYLGETAEESFAALVRAHTRTGRPLGDDAFIEELEARLDRSLRPRKRGPKPRLEVSEDVDSLSVISSAASSIKDILSP